MQSDVPDLVGIVEALYELECPTDQWLRTAAEKLRPLLDGYGTGVGALLYECPDPCMLRPTHALLCDVSDDIQALLFEGMKTFPTIFVAEAYLNGACYLAADVRGWNDISTIRDGSAPAHGFADGLILNAAEPDGAGCWFGSPRPERARIPDALYLTLTRIRGHVSSAHRLRRKHRNGRELPAAAEAVLDASGRVQHASGPAKEGAARAVLEHAAHSMGEARRRRVHGGRRETVDGWPDLVADRWTLIEHFESDGKRFTLAMDNRPQGPSVDLLSKRELQVATKVAAGSSDKAIAYELGLSASTVRVLLSRAASKLGVRTRRELVGRLALGGSSRERLDE
jgi:DNA-binding CsgD family transcriptional regulator